MGKDPSAQTDGHICMDMETWIWRHMNWNRDMDMDSE